MAESTFAHLKLQKIEMTYLDDSVNPMLDLVSFASIS